MWPFKKKPNSSTNSSQIKEIDEMLEKLDVVNKLDKDDLCDWKDDFPNYKEAINELFKLNKFWIDINYMENMELIKDTKIEDMTINQIKSLLTFHKRSERFSYGSWENMIKNGDMKEIKNRLTKLKNENV